jgi:hypothetical protein
VLTAQSDSPWNPSYTPVGDRRRSRLPPSRSRALRNQLESRLNFRAIHRDDPAVGFFRPRMDDPDFRTLPKGIRCRQN